MAYNYYGSGNLLINLSSAASFPIIFVVLSSVINNAWLHSLLFAFDRFYEVAGYCLLSIVFFLNSSFFFTLRFAIIFGSVFLFYLFIGILNNSFSATSVILSVLFWINCFVTYSSIKKLRYIDLVVFAQFLIVSQCIFLVAVDFASWIISYHGLPGLVETILPVAIFGIFLLIFLDGGEKNPVRFYWGIIICLLYFTISIVADWHLNVEKFQKIQLGLIVYTMLFFCVLHLFRAKFDEGRLFHIFGPVSVLVLISVFVMANFADIVQGITEIQPSSGYLRFAVNVAMLNDMSDVSMIFGKGLGSSWKYFPVNDLHPDAFMFEFESMFPHSGLFVLLYEYGVIGLAVAGFLVIRLLLIRNNTVKTVCNTSWASGSLVSWLMLGVILFFLIQNGMYVQGVPSGDLYFQSNAILYFVLIRLILMSRT